MNSWLPNASYPFVTCTSIMREMKGAVSTNIVVSNEMLCKKEMAKDFSVEDVT